MKNSTMKFNIHPGSKKYWCHFVAELSKPDKNEKNKKWKLKNKKWRFYSAIIKPHAV